jgi:hypothetical protein
MLHIQNRDEEHIGEVEVLVRYFIRPEETYLGRQVCVYVRGSQQDITREFKFKSHASFYSSGTLSGLMRLTWEGR